MPDMTLPFAHVTSLADCLDVQAQEAREESRAQSKLADHLQQTAIRLRIAINRDAGNAEAAHVVAQGKGADHG